MGDCLLTTHKNRGKLFCGGSPRMTWEDHVATTSESSYTVQQDGWIGLDCFPGSTTPSSNTYLKVNDITIYSYATLKRGLLFASIPVRKGDVIKYRVASSDDYLMFWEGLSSMSAGYSSYSIGQKLTSIDITSVKNQTYTPSSDCYMILYFVCTEYTQGDGWRVQFGNTTLNMTAGELYYTYGFQGTMNLPIKSGTPITFSVLKSGGELHADIFSVIS